MIQLASDPRPGRLGWRAGPAAHPETQAQPRTPPPSHPWPFISRPLPRAVAQAGTSAPRRDSGS